MGCLSFDPGGLAHLPTKHHGKVTLSKWKWEIICAKPERQWYKYNEEKIPTTLIAPDAIRHHNVYDGQLVYYKEFSQYKLSDKIEVPAALINKFRFFAVIIDTKTNKICTVYPVGKPKKGKEFKPEGEEKCAE